MGNSPHGKSRMPLTSPSRFARCTIACVARVAFRDLSHRPQAWCLMTEKALLKALFTCTVLVGALFLLFPMQPLSVPY